MKKRAIVIDGVTILLCLVFLLNWLGVIEFSWEWEKTAAFLSVYFLALLLDRK